MKKQLMVFSLILTGLIAGVGIVKAQSELIYGTVKTTIPFAFYAGDSRFPAGSYTIKRLNELTPGVMEISTADGRVGAIFLVHPDQANKDAKATEMVFNKYGSRFFLSGITVQGSDLSIGLDKSHYETLVAAGETPGAGRRIPGEHKGSVKK